VVIFGVNMTDVNFKSPKADIWSAYKDLLAQAGSVSTGEKVVEKINDNTFRLGEILNDEVQKVIVKIKNATQTLADIKTTSVALSDSIKKEEEEIRKRRTREEDDYQYEFEKRKKKQEDELSARQNEIKEMETELSELRNLAKTFDTKLEKAIKEAEGTKEKELKTIFDYEKVLSKQTAESTQNLLLSKIESSNKMVDDLKAENTKLKEAVTQANSQLTRIAEKAVEKSQSSKNGTD